MLAPLALAVSLLAPAAANAGSAVGDAVQSTVVGTVTKSVDTLSGAPSTGCFTSPSASQPFARWGDRASYVEAPGGSFEAGSGPAWTASGPTSVVAENEPWKVSGRAGDARSMVLGVGGSITSAALCAGLEYPTIRLFARAPRGSALALITVLYPSRNGLLAAAPLGIIAAGSTWQPTLLSLTASGLPLITGGSLAVRIAPIAGQLQVDDVYVDPYRRS